MIWTNSQLAAWAQEAENEICLKLNLILDRVGLATTIGQSIFQVPDYVNSIRRITFQGFKIDPSSMADVINTLSSPGAVISSSRPLNYAYNGFGQSTIKLYPSVGITTSAPSGDLFNATAIASGLIVEFWRAPDFNNSYNRVPDWFRRVITKTYVLKSALSSEGPGQDLAGSAYFDAEYKYLLKVLGNVNSCVFLTKQNILGDGYDINRKDTRGRPQLPPNYPRTY